MKRYGNKLSQIISVDEDGYSIRLCFEDGFEGTVRLGHLFQKPRGLIAEITKGGMFRQCFIENGALAWPNGLEFCPDAVRRWIDEQSSQQAA